MVCDVCDMLIPPGAEVESLHASERDSYGLNHLHYVTASIPQGGIAPAFCFEAGELGHETFLAPEAIA